MTISGIEISAVRVRRCGGWCQPTTILLVAVFNQSVIVNNCADMSREQIEAWCREQDVQIVDPPWEQSHDISRQVLPEAA